MIKNHAYRDLSIDQMEELFSNYLIDSWSFSKVNTFARNEKEFEMQYLYGIGSKIPANTYAGTAYHASLKFFFNGLQSGVKYDVIDLEKIAFDMINELPANKWKIQKTTPTIEECINQATKTAGGLIRNFLKESDVYLSEIKEIISVEEYATSWLNINGVDIPLPCHSVIDLVIKTNDDKIVIIDHKSKRSFSDEQELKFTGGKQGITYVLVCEEKIDIHVDEVWFIENKYSQNRDGSPQLMPFKIQMDEDTRRLYEALIYEPLKRMIEAVNNPDYVYLINDYDTLCDKAELHEFWARTMIAEVDDFNIPESKKEAMKQRLRKIRDASLATISPSVIKNFKSFTEQFIPYDLSGKDMKNEEKIEHILKSFGIVTQVQHKFEGFSSVTYLLAVNAGVSISSIMRFKLDIANALDVSNVRIMKELFVHEGKSYLAIESSKKREENLIFHKDFLKENSCIPLGVDNFGNLIQWNLNNPSTPHMLVCGATGSGKSVFLRSTIEYCKQAGISKIVVFDPKFEFTTEFSQPFVSVFSAIEDIELEMGILVEEMNGLVKSGSHRKTLVVFDEFADAVANSRTGNDLKNYSFEQTGSYKNGAPKMQRVCTSTDKSLEENLRILLQKGRSCGFRIIAATQRASVKVITGDAKVNFPVQVCFRVPKEVDSKVVLDESGAESLQGKGDGLIKSPEYMDTIRFQAFYKPN